jgi:two-component system response regulator YesN
MKVLIVDDERHVREAIQLLVDWSSHGIDTVLTAADAVSAMELIRQERPEFVFTDMTMPGMHGTELLEWLQQNYPDTRTVVISGYDDFDYVRKTVKYGGFDYLLKPIDPDQLTEAVVRIVASYCELAHSRAENQRATMENNEIRPVYWDKMFSQLLAEPEYLTAIREPLARDFRISLDGLPCRIAILSVESVNPIVRAKFASGLDLLYFSLLNICNEFLRKAGYGYAFRQWNSVSDIVLLLWKFPEDAAGLLGRINAGLQAALGGACVFGLGSVQRAPRGLPQSLREAAHALNQRNLLIRAEAIHAYRPGTVVNPGSSLTGDTGKAVYLADYEPFIRAAVTGGNEKQLAAVLGQWFASVRSQPVLTMEQLKAWMNEYQLMRHRWTTEGAGLAADTGVARQGQIGVGLPFTDEGVLDLNAWEAQWQRELAALCRNAAIGACVGKEEPVISRIEKYIRCHYQQDLSLAVIAERFFLSREYISRRFKQEFGENLSDYIGRVRTQQAKLLLANPHIRIAQVASMVGYADEKYFSKVFKKLCGQSPNDYRRQTVGR